MVPGGPRDRNVRSRCRCSMCPAIHISSRSWLRSSSTHEPSDPPLRVVIVVRPKRRGNGPANGRQPRSRGARRQTSTYTVRTQRCEGSLAGAAARRTWPRRASYLSRRPAGRPQSGPAPPPPTRALGPRLSPVRHPKLEPRVQRCRSLREHAHLVARRRGADRAPAPRRLGDPPRAWATKSAVVSGGPSVR